MQAIEDEGGFEATSLDNDNEDDNALTETIAASVNDQDLQDFCTASEDSVVASAMQAFASPAAARARVWLLGLGSVHTMCNSAVSGTMMVRES